MGKDMDYLDKKYIDFHWTLQFFRLEGNELKANFSSIPKSTLNQKLSPIDLSIGKWIRIASLTRKHEICIDDGGANTCFLCQNHLVPYVIEGKMEKFCLECPIKRFTGKCGCEGTPYLRYGLASCYEPNVHACYFYASQEVHFLLKVREMVKRQDGFWNTPIKNIIPNAYK
jgi:hypothetical protein